MSAQSPREAHFFRLENGRPQCGQTLLSPSSPARPLVPPRLPRPPRPPPLPFLSPMPSARRCVRCTVEPDAVRGGLRCRRESRRAPPHRHAGILSRHAAPSRRSVPEPADHARHEHRRVRLPAPAVRRSPGPRRAPRTGPADRGLAVLRRREAPALVPQAEARLPPGDDGRLARSPRQARHAVRDRAVRGGRRLHARRDLRAGGRRRGHAARRRRPARLPARQAAAPRGEGARARPPGAPVPRLRQRPARQPRLAGGPQALAHGRLLPLAARAARRADGGRRARGRTLELRRGEPEEAPEGGEGAPARAADGAAERARARGDRERRARLSRFPRTARRVALPGHARRRLALARRVSRRASREVRPVRGRDRVGGELAVPRRADADAEHGSADARGRPRARARARARARRRARERRGVRAPDHRLARVHAGDLRRSLGADADDEPLEPHAQAPASVLDGRDRHRPDRRRHRARARHRLLPSHRAPHGARRVHVPLRDRSRRHLRVVHGDVRRRLRLGHGAERLRDEPARRRRRDHDETLLLGLELRAEDERLGHGATGRRRGTGCSGAGCTATRRRSAATPAGR